MTHPHPFQHLICDVLSIIFEYFIYFVSNEPLSSISSADMRFLRQLIQCVSFSEIDHHEKQHITVEAFLEELQLNSQSERSPLLYLDVSEQRTLTDSTFEHFRGIRQIHLGDTSQSSYTNAAFENLREVEVLYLHNCPRRITNAAFVNLRRVQELSLNSSITGAAFINLRQCRKLSMMEMDLNDVDFENLRNLDELDMYDCGGFSPKAFTNLRRLRVIRFTWQRGWDQEAVLMNLRGIAEVAVYDENIPRWKDTLMVNLRGVQNLRMPNFRPHCFKELRGIETFSTIPYQFDFIPVPPSTEEVKNLIGVKSLELNGITDEMMPFFRGIKELITHSPELTDVGLKELMGCEVDLQLYDSPKVTHAMYAELTKHFRRTEE